MGCSQKNGGVKGIVHFEIKIWYPSAYPKGIQDVGVFFSSVDPILMFLGQTVLVCQSYNGRYRSLSIRGKKNMHREIQIKQFPIVTTHWWPKTRNERFVWENEQYLYHFYLLYTTLSKWSECAHASGVWRVCARSGLCKRRKAPEVTRAFKGGSEHLGGMRARTQITWTWLCTRGKNDINTVRFLTQTARFVS